MLAGLSVHDLRVLSREFVITW